ncbi:right-handed parallel beta-helix repeat-containing protein [Enterovirga aerilata]|uniref:Right-handed parallel beta-helix repeat-containing protein n=1 Tax=Enterovirga aerilata TaxID=2730920 RepID=A0A849I9D0_9HYPH|nr:right-handed parallel beta-helix repeat-containing protein [Enterovirga sp. DB1703]NNM74424.1 right-handed parallel beta-helix repeat-containing protein [Enterovirga sp. DB1703]
MQRGLLAFPAAALLLVCAEPVRAAAPACDARTRAALLEPALGPDDVARLTCSLRLGPDEVVTKRLLLEGRAASGVEIDCRGGRIGRPEAEPPFPRFTVEIRSRPPEGGRTEWDRPEGVAIRNCTIAGPIRIWGMAINGQGEVLKLSSRASGHTERAQAAAPTGIAIESSTLQASGAIPLYLGPGVTGVSLTNSRVVGRSASVAVYLDAESAGNTIAGNNFDIETGREAIAVDGSARNRIADNRFRIAWRGGIFLYRNCGEGGTIRHQTPSFNTISGNRFSYALPLHLPAISVGSREGWRLYCGEDAGYPFGSSADNGDHATGNVVENNVVE